MTMYRSIYRKALLLLFTAGLGLSCASQTPKPKPRPGTVKWALEIQPDGTWQIVSDRDFHRFFNTTHAAFAPRIASAKSPDEQRRLFIERDLAVARERLKYPADKELVKEVIGSTRATQGTNPTGQIFRMGDISAIPRQRFTPSDPASWVYEEKKLSAGSRMSDAMTAIVRFDRQLKARGVQLIVLPVPNSSQVFAHRLHPDIDIEDYVWHPWAQMIVKLLEHDVEVIDLLDLYKTWSGENTVLNYIDHHWGKAGLDIVGHELARRLERFRFEERYYVDSSKLERKKIAVPMPALIPYWDKISESAVKARMGIPDLYETEAITIKGAYIYAADEPSDSPVLIMGDSFIPHMADESAGIISCLAWHSHIIPSAISRDAGAAKPPEWYRSQVAGKGREPAVVIWQIYGSAMSEITDLNDWKIVAMSEPPKALREELASDPWAAARPWLAKPGSPGGLKSGKDAAAPESHTSFTVRGKVRAVSAIPRPEDLKTYPDALYAFQVEIMESADPQLKLGTRILVHARFMDDYRFLKENILAAGDTCDLHIEQLSAVHAAMPAIATMQLVDSLDDWESEVYYAHRIDMNSR